MQADRGKISPTANENAFWLKDREIIFEVANRNYGQFPIWEAFRCGAALTERIAWVFTEEVLRALLLREARPGLYRHDTSSHGAVWVAYHPAEYCWSGGRKSSVAPCIMHRLIQRLPLSGARHHYGIRRHLRREIRHPMHHVMLRHGTFRQMRHHAIRLGGTCLPMRNYAIRLRGMCPPSSWSKTRWWCVSRMRRLRVRDWPHKHD